MGRIKEATALLKKNGYEVTPPGQVEARRRAAQMLQSYIRNNGNMALIGKEFSISRERVRQALGKHFGLKGTGFKDNTDKVKKVKISLDKHSNDVVKVAEELHISAWAVNSIRKNYFPELIPPRLSKATLSDKDLQDKYKEHDGNIRRMAEDMRCDPSTLYDRLIKFGLRGRGNFRVTDEQILKAVKENNGVKAQAARSLGITPATVSTRLIQIESKMLQ